MDEEEEEEEKEEEEMKTEEARTKREYVEGKYEKLRRLKAAGEIKEYEIDWDEMWRECAQRKEEEGMSHFGQESVENGGRDREGPQTKDRSHLHSSRGEVVVAAASEIAPRVLGKVPAQSSESIAEPKGFDTENVEVTFEGLFQHSSHRSRHSNEGISTPSKAEV